MGTVVGRASLLGTRKYHFEDVCGHITHLCYLKCSEGATLPKKDLMLGRRTK